MGYWNSPIVLNEFLPNADNYFEFIEFYNKGASQIDMNGYYVMADNNNIDVNTTNTNTYSGGSTTIDPDSWLVITTGSDELDDASGTLTLYNSNGVEMDSYTYDASDHNINNNPGGTNNLVLYLPFDGDLLDASENHNNGTNYGTVFDSGRINQGSRFDGVDYIEITDDDSLDITDAITLEAWVYPESWNNSYENNILTKGGDSDYGVWNLHYKTESNGFRFELDNGFTQVLLEETPSTALNTWYHVLGTYDGNSMKLYVNGALSNSKSINGAIVTNNAPLRIGKQYYWSTIYSYWEGMIDEVKIYNRALDADEVLEHYNDVGVSIGEVPVDKSYARIPDGIGNWIDPIPTPGTPNKLDTNETVGTAGPVEEIKAEPIKTDFVESNILVDSIPEVTITGAETASTTIVMATEEVASSTEAIVSDLAIASSTEDIILEDTVTTETIVTEVIDSEEPVVSEEEVIAEEPVVSEEGAINEEEVIIEETEIDTEIESAIELEPIGELTEQPIEQEEDTIIEETPVIEEESEIITTNPEEEINPDENEE